MTMKKIAVGQVHAIHAIMRVLLISGPTGAPAPGPTSPPGGPLSIRMSRVWHRGFSDHRLEHVETTLPRSGQSLAPRVRIGMFANEVRI